MSFAEWMACLGCGLDLWKWETGQYPKEFKVRVLAFYSLKNLVDMHVQDAEQRYVEQHQKKPKAR